MNIWKHIKKKRSSLTALFIVICMVLSACGTQTALTETGQDQATVGASQEADREDPAAETASDTGEWTRGKFANGSRIAGFVVDEIMEYEPARSVVYHMIHEKTGAEVVWTANDDPELAFDITFHTLTDNDRGVPHVFEHACLGGSDKYPDSQLWESMFAGLYMNFMNASTYPTITSYLLSSLSEDQLLKAMDVYLDGVFHPLLLKEPKIMQREAYHLELDDPDGEIAETGIVYSEMLARIEEDSVSQAFLHAACPGSAWANESGGHPDHIPDLTQEDLKTFHEKYYHPSNSVVTLYGDMDIDRVLGMIDQEYFSKYEKKEISFADSGFTPVKGTVAKQVETLKSDSGEEERNYLYMIPLRGLTDEEQVLLTALGSSALYRKGTRLYERIQQDFPEAVFDISIVDYAEPMMVFDLSKLTSDSPDAEAFRAAVSESISQQMGDGLKLDLLKSLLRQFRKNKSLLRENTGIGLIIYEQLAEGYAHGDTLRELKREVKLLENGEEWLESGMLQKLIEDHLTDPDDSVLLDIRRRPGTLEEWQQSHNEAFVKQTASMTDEERKDLVRETQDFRAWTEANNDPANSMLDQVRAVTAKDLPEMVKHYQAKEEDAGGMHVISSAYDNDLVGMKLYLDASAIPAEDIRTLSLAVRLLGKLDTDDFSAEELDQKMTDLSFGKQYSGIATNFDGTEFVPYVVMTGLCYPDEVESLFEIADSLLSRTKFTDRDYIRWRCSTIVNDGKADVLSNPNGLLISMANAALSNTHRFLYEKDGLPFLQYCQRVSTLPDEQLDGELKRMQELLEILKNQNRFTLGAIGREENVEIVKKAGKKLFDRFSSEIPESVYDTESLKPISRSAVILTGGSRNYNLEALDYRKEGIPFSYRYPVFAELTEERVMTPLFRLKGGAYGAKSGIGKIGAFLYTIRDPEVLGTYEQFENISSLIRQESFDEDMIDSYIMSTYGNLGIPDPPLVGAETAVEDKLRGIDSYQEEEERLKEYKSFKAADIDAYAGIWDAAATSPNHVRYSAGAVEDMKKAADAFDEVISWYVQ